MALCKAVRARLPPSVSVNEARTAMALVILLSLKTMESLENGFAIPLFSMRTVFLALLQHQC